METIFQLSNTLVLPVWLLMILLPHWRGTKRIVSSHWLIVPWLLAYSFLVVPNLLSLAGELASPSIEGIAALLGTPEGATLAWIHFIAFDLFVGRWIYLDSRQHGFTAWLISPILALTLLFGPFGMLIYLVVRSVLPRRETATLLSNKTQVAPN